MNVCSLDRSILGFILVNTQKKRALVSMWPGQAGPQQRDTARSLRWDSTLYNMIKMADCFSSVARRLDIARTFYRTVVGAVLPSCATPSPHIAELGGTLVPDHVPHARLHHPVSEVFSCSEYHKATNRCYLAKSQRFFKQSL